MSGVGSILFLIGLALAASFLFAGMETGVLALNRFRIRHLARSGNGSARLLNAFLEEPEGFLWTILIGNTIANFLAVSLTFVLLNGLLGDRPVWLALALLPAVFAGYALGDLLPKMLFRQHPNRLCLLVARPFRLVHVILSPLVDTVAWMSGQLIRWTGGRELKRTLFGNRDELRQMMQESAQPLTAEERQMVNRVLDLQTATVGAIAVPFDQTTVVDQSTPLEEVLRLCREKGLTRLPVGDRAGGRIRGIVSLRVTLYQEDLDARRPVGAFLVPALYFEDSMRLERALERLRSTGQRLAIVRDRNGREVGLVTLEGILGFLFGEVNL